MALTKQTMTDEQRKSVALEYLKAFRQRRSDIYRRLDPGSVRIRRTGLLAKVAEPAKGVMLYSRTCLV
jgi:hypothetical protein